MNIFRTPHLRGMIVLQICAYLTGFIICLFFSIPASVVLLTVALVSLIVQDIFLSMRQKKISELCDEISSILHGAEHVAFDMFQEGELSILSSEIQKMTVRLREQNSLLRQDRQFLKEALEDMSHQLRTPLTTATLILDLMREPDLTKQQRIGYVREMRELLAKMQWIVETMLSLSRLEAGAVTFRTEMLSVSELIKSAYDPLLISMELKNITLSIKIEGDPWFSGDKQYCCEAIENLLKNCLEHTPLGGEISIKAYENNIFTGITISDTGEGIEEKDLPHIFERFYRGTEFSKNGYGIGLAFAQRIITSQNGSLQVKNADPHGAQFDIRIYKR